MPDVTSKAYCRLFLATPNCFDLTELQVALAAAISGGDIASLLIRHEDADKLKEAAMAVTEMAQEAGIAVLIENDIDIAVACGADGVQVDGVVQTYQNARGKLGDDKVVGAFCRSDRHSAMSAGEAGADYVAFLNDTVAGEKEPVAHWWARVFEVPCVLIEPLELEPARVAVANRVDFICPPQAMWADEQSAAETVRLFNAMIEDTQIETV